MNPNVPIYYGAENFKVVNILQEATINIYPAQVDPYADIFSSIPSITRRLKKLVKEFPGEVSLTETAEGVVMRLPSRWVKIIPERRKKNDGV